MTIPCPHSTKRAKKCQHDHLTDIVWHQPRLNCRVTMITFTFSIAFRNRRYMSSSVLWDHMLTTSEIGVKSKTVDLMSTWNLISQTVEVFSHPWYFWSSWTCSASPFNLSAGVSQPPYASPRYSGPLCSPENKRSTCSWCFGGPVKTCEIWTRIGEKGIQGGVRKMRVCVALCGNSFPTLCKYCTQVRGRVVAKTWCATCWSAGDI